MLTSAIQKRLPVLLIVLVCFAFCIDVSAHGEVEDGDLCVINIDQYRAHFKIYLPREYRHQQFCEGLPAPGESIFVMEYLDADLERLAIDFRIIRNETGAGLLADREDLKAISDIESVTEYYKAPQKSAGVYAVLHKFETPGAFIGIVTALSIGGETTHVAMFPFDVGRTGGR